MLFPQLHSHKPLGCVYLEVPEPAAEVAEEAVNTMVLVTEPFSSSTISVVEQVYTAP
jgi:hypothetical protein